MREKTLKLGANSYLLINISLISKKNKKYEKQKHLFFILISLLAAPG